MTPLAVYFSVKKDCLFIQLQQEVPLEESTQDIKQPEDSTNSFKLEHFTGMSFPLQIPFSVLVVFIV